MAITMAAGIGRVIAFISVGILGAFLLAAVRAQAPTATLVVALLIAAPVAALLHWLDGTWTRME